MGLIDGLLGAALGGNNNNSNNGLQGALLQAVIGMMTNQGGQQSGGLGGLLGGGQGANHDAVAGGLGNLTGMLSQLGLGDQVNSWIGTGDNQAVSADQIQNSLGSNGTLAQIAQSAGVSEGEAAGGLADLLPQLINKLTPNGQIDASDIGSVLTSLLGNNKA